MQRTDLLAKSGGITDRHDCAPSRDAGFGAPRIPIPTRCLGSSLRPFLENHPDAAGAEEIFAEVNYHAGYEPKRAIRTSGHKYIRNYELPYHPAMANIDPSPTKSWMLENEQLPYEVPGEELYDLMADPSETHKLAGSAAHAGVLSEMRERLERWMRKTDDPLLNGPIPAPPGARIEPPELDDKNEQKLSKS